MLDNLISLRDISKSFIQGDKRIRVLENLSVDINKGEFLIDDKDSLWKGKSLYELYQEAYTPWEWHEPIMKHANELGMICFSTPFDDTAVDYLEDLNVPAYKIASFENNHLPLIKKVASTGKPMIISTGMASVSEMDEMVQTIRDAGCNQFILLKCTSTYPATPENSNVLTIPHMRKLFNCEVGLSDHTFGLFVSQTALAIGANVIERHFTLSRTMEGPDHILSSEPDEMAALNEMAIRIPNILGDGIKRIQPNEYITLNSQRKCIYAAKDIEKGEVISKENISIKGPGGGILPKYIDIIIGRKATKFIESDTPISWEKI